MQCGGYIVAQTIVFSVATIATHTIALAIVLIVMASPASRLPISATFIEAISAIVAVTKAAVLQEEIAVQM